MEFVSVMTTEHIFKAYWSQCSLYSKAALINEDIIILPDLLKTDHEMHTSINGEISNKKQTFVIFETGKGIELNGSTTKDLQI